MHVIGSCDHATDRRVDVGDANRAGWHAAILGMALAPVNAVEPVGSCTRAQLRYYRTGSIRENIAMPVSRRSFVATVGAGAAGLFAAPLITWRGHEELFAFQGVTDRRADRLLATKPGMI